MCGRFGLFTAGEELARAFSLSGIPVLSPRYNIAPTQDIAFIRPDANDKRQLVFMRWGLIPSWAKDPGSSGAKFGAGMINARSESVFSKPAFRNAVRHRRGLIPIDGFYEWDKKGRQKIPYFFSLRNREPFALAGIWEQWTGGENGAFESCVIVTTEANELVRPLHDRMPVVISPENHELWLDPQKNDPSELSGIFKPYNPEVMDSFHVSSYVNDIRNEGPKCIRPVTWEQPSLF